MSKIVAIDPSINRVGHACIDGLTRDDDGIWDGSKAKWHYGYWDISGTFLSHKFKEIADNIIITYDGINPDEGDHLVVEWPQYFDQARGQIAAQKGHTINLAAIDAYIAGFFQLPPSQWHPIFPSDWKGNLSKEVTRQRFFRALGQKKIYKVDHNAVDAIMMLRDWCHKHGIRNEIIDVSMNHLDAIDEE